MRILGFSKKWPKLNKQWYSPDRLTFTTFRYPRRDKDWQAEEVVQVVYKPRSKEREPLGIARIIRKQEKHTGEQFRYSSHYTNEPNIITPEEAKEDGFEGRHGGGDIEGLKDWLRASAGHRFYEEPIVHKLTLYWITKFER